MAKHIVCISFDFDAMSGWIARGMTTPTPVSRGEFGVIGAGRILALLKKHGIPATWFIPGHTLETYPNACEQVLEAGHEIGHHGWTHVPPASLSRDEEEAELARANEQIRKLTGRYARGYRSPSWDLSPHSGALLLEHGFYYESSMMGNDHSPYRGRLGDRIELQKPAVFGKESRVIEMPLSGSLDGYPHCEGLRAEKARLHGLKNAGGVLAKGIDA